MTSLVFASAATFWLVYAHKYDLWDSVLIYSRWLFSFTFDLPLERFWRGYLSQQKTFCSPPATLPAPVSALQLGKLTFRREQCVTHADVIELVHCGSFACCCSSTFRSILQDSWAFPRLALMWLPSAYVACASVGRPCSVNVTWLSSHVNRLSFGCWPWMITQTYIYERRGRRHESFVLRSRSAALLTGEAVRLTYFLRAF